MSVFTKLARTLTKQQIWVLFLETKTAPCTTYLFIGPLIGSAVDSVLEFDAPERSGHFAIGVYLPEDSETFSEWKSTNYSEKHAGSFPIRHHYCGTPPWSKENNRIVKPNSLKTLVERTVSFSVSSFPDDRFARVL